MIPDTVVVKRTRLTKAELQAKIMLGWARAIDRFGKGTFADKLSISIQAMDKQLSGSLPSMESIDAALDADDRVLDDWLAAKGKRLVDVDAVCNVDDMSLLIARVLVMLQEAEHPDGPGGRAIVPQEYLAGEGLMRDLHRSSARWLDRCADIRRPRGVAA